MTLYLSDIPKLSGIKPFLVCCKPSGRQAPEGTRELPELPQRSVHFKKMAALEGGLGGIQPH